VISYRTFRNGDPPALVDIWKRCPASRGLAARVTLSVFDQLVFAKPYFEHHGLILAFDEQLPVGFVHAGFGPNEDRNDLDRRRGVVSMLMVTEHTASEEIARELLNRAEQYLGATANEIFAIGVGEICPFYLGLYGGCGLPGVLQSDVTRQTIFRAAGFEEIDCVKVFQRPLLGFRPPVHRLLMQFRRTTEIDVKLDPPARDWWSACTTAGFDQFRYELTSQADNRDLAQATLWSMEALSKGWGEHALGLFDISVASAENREALAIHLLAEAMKQASDLGMTCVEGQAMQRDVAAINVFEQLGFQQIDTGTVLRK
jgi:ribosomal protein S18 acetylase RimI-like enzyme